MSFATCWSRELLRLPVAKSQSWIILFDSRIAKGQSWIILFDSRMLLMSNLERLCHGLMWWLLEIAESKPRTDDGWTLVQTKNKQVRFKAKVETVNVSGQSKTKDETLQVSGILKPGLLLETREQNSSCAHI